ncbi:MAG: hypothetical protein CL573_08190 [Alphaproteobacteria bacterium]|nr:hypothetical protein [Alphaproteobacteria bacterium]
MARICRQVIRPLTAVMVVAASCVAGPVAMAQDLPINAFYGYFQGSGIAESSDSLYFGITVRDLDVKIGAEGTGFYVKWTSVIRGGDDLNNPKIRRHTQRRSFAPSSAASVFDGVDRQDPRDNGLAWAYVRDQTLSVNVIQITAAGGYVIQTYNRTLEGTGMHLRFINIANGERQRGVDARLVKVGN